MTNEYVCANPASSRKWTKLENLERRNPVTETGKVNDNVAQLAIPSQYRNSEWSKAEQFSFHDSAPREIGGLDCHFCQRLQSERIIRIYIQG